MLSIRRIGAVLSTAVLIGLCAGIASTSQASASTPGAGTWQSGDSVGKYQSNSSDIYLIRSSGQVFHETSTTWPAYKKSAAAHGHTVGTVGYFKYGFAKTTGTSAVYSVWTCTSGFSATHETAAQYKADGSPTSQSTSLKMKSSLCYSSPGKLAYITND